MLVFLPAHIPTSQKDYQNSFILNFAIFSIDKKSKNFPNAELIV